MLERSTLGAGVDIALIAPIMFNNRSIFVRGLLNAGGTPGLTIAGVWQGTGAGTNLTTVVNEWFRTTSPDHLRISSTEMNKLVFLAHDLRDPKLRGHTAYYDDANVTGTGGRTVVQNLTAAWAIGGQTDPLLQDNKIRFRGVLSWRDHLWGWGFGTNTADMPHLLRVSKPGRPLVFEEYGWIPVGAPGDPILNVVPLSGTILICKGDALYTLEGWPVSQSFARVADEKTGLAGSRLVTVHKGVAYGWGKRGPWRTNGGPAEPIGERLGLRFPANFDVEASKNYRQGFATYSPEDNAVIWVFGSRGYVFNLDADEWTYDKYPISFNAAGILYAGGGAEAGGGDNTEAGYTGPSRGRPEYAADSATANTTSTINADWRNVTPENDEVVEIFFKAAANAWPASPSATVPINNATTHKFTGLPSGTLHDVAFRYNRNGQYTAGYTGTPDTWPPSARGQETTDMANITNLQGVHTRPGIPENRVTLTWTVGDPNATYQIFRDGAQIGTAIAGSSAYLDDFTDAANLFGLRSYEVRSIRPNATKSATVSVDVKRPSPTINSYQQNATDPYRFDGTVTPHSLDVVEIWHRITDSTQNTDWALVNELTPSSLSSFPFRVTLNFVGSGSGISNVRARHRYPNGTHSAWSNEAAAGFTFTSDGGGTEVQLI